LGLAVTPALRAQETTGGVRGVVRDPSGAVVPNAKVVISSSALVRNQSTMTDSGGHYQFSNLPPGTYTVAASASGFATMSRPGVVIQVGYLLTVDFSMKVGTTTTTVEVKAAPPQINLTKTTAETNISENELKYIPHGFSYQSVIEFAPGATNEPLQGAVGSVSMGGQNVGTGGGGMSAGSMSNGRSIGFSIDGAADSENSYLINGLASSNVIGGFSQSDVPTDFLQSVTVKTAGVSAEYGGALGGVVNAVTKRGTDAWHGSGSFTFQDFGANGMPQPFSEYNPAVGATPTSWGFLDPSYLQYQGKQDSGHILVPGFTIGGPLVHRHLYFFGGFEPEITSLARTVSFTSGKQTINQNSKTWFANGRLDYAASNKITLFGSWFYAPERLYGEFLPEADSTQGYLNADTTNSPGLYSHNFGFYSPSTTYTTGANFIISPNLVDSVHFGYYFYNYHDFGMPSGGDTLQWTVTTTAASGATVVPNPTDCTNFGTASQSCPALPASLQEVAGYSTSPSNANYTSYNTGEQLQLYENLSWIKSGWWGTHNFQFGYQLSRLSNNVLQHYNQPNVQMVPGGTYSPVSSTGAANCAAIEAADGTTGCAGKYGYLWVFDYGSHGSATSFNHSLYAQDTWTIGHGLTLDLGLRMEHENLPAENQPSGGIANPIDFGWGKKIAPQIGAAWDVFQNGKLKIYGDYGVHYQTMPLNLAISSFGGQYWENCYYALDTAILSNIDPIFNAQTRDCPGTGSTTQAVFPGGKTPAGLTYIESQNFRLNATTCPTCTATEEGVAPGLNPYREHQSDLGFEYQLTPTTVLSARWDRRRLDHVIEDSAIFNGSTGGETFVIVNPGQGVDSTFNGFYKFLYGSPAYFDPSNPSAGICSATSTPSCPIQVPGQRDWDSVDVRLAKTFGSHWQGMFSYTWSRLWGNYSGLTSSDISDGAGGRNAPNNSRAFDEPYMQFNDSGTSSSGLLNTDRPNEFKGYAYYTLNEGHNLSTALGVAQFLYSGTPVSTFADVGYNFAPYFQTSGGWDAYVAGRGKFVPVTQDPNTGAVTVGTPYTRRTPWWNDTDFQITQTFKVSEDKSLSFDVNFINLFDQRSVTAYNTQIDSSYQAFAVNTSGGFNSEFIAPGGKWIADGIPFYAAAMNPYNLQSALNNSAVSDLGSSGPVTVNSQYGKPLYWQVGRTIWFGVKFTF
jgi:hypothetical protein